MGWELVGSLLGPPGTPGNVWYADAGAPDDGDGLDGDFYLDSTTGDFYQKVTGHWTLKGNLTGPAGGGAAIVNDIPVESADGSRTTFTVPGTYVAGSLSVFLNGLRERNITELTGTTFQFSTAPISGDTIDLLFSVP